MTEWYSKSNIITMEALKWVKDDNFHSYKIKTIK